MLQRVKIRPDDNLYSPRNMVAKTKKHRDMYCRYTEVEKVSAVGHVVKKHFRSSITVIQYLKSKTTTQIAHRMLKTIGTD